MTNEVDTGAAKQEAPDRIYIHPTCAEWHPHKWPQEQSDYVEYVRADFTRVCADSDSGEAEWTKDAPIADGVYWWRADANDSQPDIHSVVNGRFYEIAETRSTLVQNFGGEWLGPITPARFTPSTPGSVRDTAREIAERWFSDDLPDHARVHSTRQLQLQALAESVIESHIGSRDTARDQPTEES